MVRSIEIFNAVIFIDLKVISCIIFEKYSITIRGSLIFFIYVFIIFRISLVSWLEFNGVFNIARIFFLVRVFQTRSFPGNGELIHAINHLMGILNMIIIRSHVIISRVESVIQISHDKSIV